MKKAKRTQNGRSPSSPFPASKKNQKEKIRKLELLLEYSKKNVLEKSVDSLLSLLADEAKALLDADRCTIFILNKKSKVLSSKVAQGTKGNITVPWDKGIAGEAVKTGELLNIRNAYHDARFNPDVDKKTGYLTRSILTAPMKNLRGEVLGVFQVLNKKTMDPFNAQDEKTLTILTSHAAVAIENAQLYQQVREAAQDTIFRLAAAAEYKDKDTAFHIVRMSKYSALIAKALGYSKKFCEDILMASPMHDIGKLGVPDAILMKPGELDDGEWKEMKKHTLYGAEILKDSENELIQMSHRIAISHHEKFDGSGYPKGLKGDSIPIEGRIIALADVFDALTSKRIYKEKCSMEETLKIIRAGSGKHFDPKVVEAFERSLPEIFVVMQHHPEGEGRFHESWEHDLDFDIAAAFN